MIFIFKKVSIFIPFDKHNYFYHGVVIIIIIFIIDIIILQLEILKWGFFTFLHNFSLPRSNSRFFAPSSSSILFT